MPANQQIISIHQPNYFPWLGYFYKITQSDVFVFLDNVEYQYGNANSITNRTKIKTSQGELFLSVPVLKKSGSLINEMELDYKQNWQTKHLKTIQANYGKAPFFKAIYNWLEPILNKPYTNLAHLNQTIILEIVSLLEITTNIKISSEQNVLETEKNMRLIQLSKLNNCNIYLSGNGARKYNDEAMFQQNNIQLTYTSFTPIEYSQLNPPFIAGLSILDALFNCSITEIKQMLH